MPLSTEDVLSIQQLAARYNFAIDSGDGEAYAGCFAPDGRFLYSTTIRIVGREKLREFAAGIGGRGQMRHMVTNLLIEGDGDEATMRAYCQVFSVDDSGASYVRSQGVYDDKLVRHEGRWLFAERRYHADAVGAKR